MFSPFVLHVHKSVKRDGGSRGQHELPFSHLCCLRISIYVCGHLSILMNVIDRSLLNFSDDVTINYNVWYDVKL